MKDAIKAFYEKGVENLKAKYTDAVSKALLDRLLSWDDLKGKIGTKYEIAGQKYQFNYANIWNSELYIPVVENKGYITFSFSKGTVTAHFLTLSCDVATNAIAVDYDPPAETTTKYSACWNTSDIKYSCKTIKITEKDENAKKTKIGVQVAPYSLSQYIIEGDLVSTTDALKDNRNLFYLVSDFPIAYNLVSYEDTTKEDYEKGILYTKNGESYRISGESYAKAYVKEQTKDTTDVKDYEHIWCNKEPSDSYNIKDFMKDDVKCSKTTTKITTLNPSQFNDLNAIIGSPLDYKDEPLKGAFDYTHIGVVPGFVKSYWSSLCRDRIFTYNDAYKLAQFAVAAFIITICGILFLGAGVGTSFLGSD